MKRFQKGKIKMIFRDMEFRIRKLKIHPTGFF